MSNRKYWDYLSICLAFILFLGIAYILLKYFLPCIIPFIFAFVTAWIVEPVVSWMNKKFHFKRGFASAICIILILLSLAGIIFLCVSRLIYEAANFIRELPSLLSGVPMFLLKLETKIDRYIDRVPDGLQAYLSNAIDNIVLKTAEIPGILSEKLIGFLSSCASCAPGVVLFCVTYAIGSFFISKTYGDIRKFFIRQLPKKFHDTVRRLKSDLFDAFSIWMKAQLTLVGITGLELIFAFAILGFKYSIVIAIITALIDALPVLGTGVVLIPWALVLFLSGDIPRAIGLLITYCIVTIARSCLEPKIVGDGFGVNPAATLLAMYTGFKLLGVAGMILFPLALMLIKQMSDKGYIKLWK